MVKSVTFGLAMLLLAQLNVVCAETPTSEFDEGAIRLIQDDDTHAAWTAVDPALTTYENAATDSEKMAAYEQMIDASSGGLLAATWTVPTGGWKIVSLDGDPSLEDIRKREWENVYFKKTVASTDLEAAHFRAVGGLLSGMCSDGEQWAEDLLLDIATRPDSNLKRSALWFAENFGEDLAASRVVSWPEWQTAFTAANDLGKAIILRNVTMLAERVDDFTVAAQIHQAVFDGSNRELKAIAIAYGNRGLGQDIIDEWQALADSTTDPVLQGLSQERLDE